MLRRISRLFKFSVRCAMSLLLMTGMLLRPAQLDAVLIHSHGDEGGHFHALSRGDIDSYHEKHDRLHQLEHMHDADAGHACEILLDGSNDENHTENCGAILVVFGDLKQGDQSSRFDAAAGIARDSHVAISVIAAPIGLTSGLSGTNAPICIAGFRPARALDAIVQSSHALLI